MSDEDDLFLAMYAEWILDQDANVTGPQIVQRIEQAWRFEDFMAQLPEQLVASVAMLSESNKT